MMDLNEREVNAEIAQREASGLNRTSLQELANLYVVRDHLFGQYNYDMSYSMAPEPKSQNEVTGEYGGSEFLRAVAGKDAADAWLIMDELMDTLRIVNQRAYNSVLRKINEL